LRHFYKPFKPLHQMKKVTFIAIAAFFTLSLASCKKDWTCKCTTTVAGVSASAETTINATKKDAEDACNATATAGGATTSCEISKK
jgi:hypothetical protein